MFNQKVNGFTQENPEYLNHSIGAPYVSPVSIHNCGTTINRYKLSEKCGSLPLQTWCSKNVATESFAMRPIVNSKEYFQSINNFLSTLIIQDRQLLINSSLANEHYSLVDDYYAEPENSLLQAVNLEVTQKLMDSMAQATDSISMFKDYNPICEGFVMTDIKINTYRSIQNKNHYYHNVVFSAVNTTRYNTISFKAELYQDTTPMMQNWNKAIKEVEMSRDVSKGINNANSNVYIYNIGMVNNTNCVTGEENECSYSGYSFMSQKFNENNLSPVEQVKWMEPYSLGNQTYDTNGNYDESGKIRITDFGPSNIENLVKELSDNNNNKQWGSWLKVNSN